MKRILQVIGVAIVLAGVAGTAPGQTAGGNFDADYRALLSQLQSMGHGYYTDAEWNAIMERVSALSGDAAASGDADSIIKAALIEASVLGDMRHQFAPALQVLRETRARLGDSTDLSRLYTKEAEILALAGDSAAIERLIAEYKASPHYRPEAYPWSGGNGPGDPLLIARPGAREGSSIPLTIMEKALRRSVSAPGTMFPDAVVTDIWGRAVPLSAYRGRIVLVDFFARGWKLWDANLAAQRDIFLRYHDEGFDILGICLEPSPVGLESMGLPWPLVANADDLTRQLGIFGQSTSYLLDRNGRVIARDLRGQDLAFAVRRALEAQ